MISNEQAVCFNLKNQSIAYQGQSVLQNINVEIRYGESVAIVGKSGSGKSSLLNTLYSNQKANSALCPQQSMLVESLSVYHNIYMGQLQHHHFLYNLINLVRPFNSHKLAITELTKELGLKQQLFKSIDKLSGGQQQRTAIGRALYQRKSIFLGDEPLSSVDPLQGAELFNLIKRSHTTIVMALHNKEMAISEFDRVIGLSSGRIAFDRPSSKVTEQQIDNLYLNANDLTYCG